MIQKAELEDVAQLAAQIVDEIRALPVRNAESARAVRRRYTPLLKGAEPELVLELARELLQTHNQRWLAYELIRYHRGAFQGLGAAELEALGRGMDSWGAVDSSPAPWPGRPGSVGRFLMN